MSCGCSGNSGGNVSGVQISGPGASDNPISSLFGGLCTKCLWFWVLLGIVVIAVLRGNNRRD